MTAGPAMAEGSPYPLGATPDRRGVNFALFSAHASRVELCLFDAEGTRELARHVLPECTDEVWHGYLPDAPPNLLYGYRVYGPFDPWNGHRFNANKLLIDPYAKALHGSLRWHELHCAYEPGHRLGDLSFDERDNAHIAPKSRVVRVETKDPLTPPPSCQRSDSVLYELHVRGYTMRHPDLPVSLRGTIAGLGHPRVIEHFHKLGITAIELMPVHPIFHDQRLTELRLNNYWGYNSINYFSLEPAYLCTGDVQEFRATTNALHAAGIEVILDVVYNHTAEGDEFGPTLSFRGIDNASYYCLSEDKRGYSDFTGCHNALDLTHPRVLQMVMDSLRYWVQAMGVDGFRFDLAVTLSRVSRHFVNRSPFLEAIAQDPLLSQVKLISEPWDLGPDGYQLGSFGPGWQEWNDRFRDDVRRFWRGDGHMIGAVASRLAGSSDIFRSHRRRPCASINFITAHDGFTLFDLVSYNRKHNEANREGSADGNDHNFSWNCGLEGPTASQQIRELRNRQRRNLMATLLLSQGVPMILAGDELGHTQQGNNNAYCQDNETSWIRWANQSNEDEEFLAFVQRLAWLRKEHSIFRSRSFLPAGGEDKTTWFSPCGSPMTEVDWALASTRSLGLHLRKNGRISVDEGASEALMLLNADNIETMFVLPEDSQRDWVKVLDTARPQETPALLKEDQGTQLQLSSHSFAVLLLASEKSLVSFGGTR